MIVSNNKYRNTLTVLGSVCLLMMTRLISHVHNFTPAEAIVLFGAVLYSSRYLAFVMPLVIMYIFDFAINNTIARPFFTEQTGLIWFSDYMLYNSLAYVCIAGIGFVFLRDLKFKNVVSGAIIASVIFFLISNFGVWMGSATLYAKTWTGFVSCYVAAIPFFKVSLLSTLSYVLIFYGSYILVKNIISKKSAIAR